jgi:putative endonuclease
VSWFLYIVECDDGSLYTGIARDPQARFEMHLAGKGARYTRAHPPRRLLVSLAFPDRSSVSRAEYRVKQMAAAEKRRLVKFVGRWQREWSDARICREMRLIAETPPLAVETP